MAFSWGLCFGFFLGKGGGLEFVFFFQMELRLKQSSIYHCKLCTSNTYSCSKSLLYDQQKLTIWIPEARGIRTPTHIGQLHVAYLSISSSLRVFVVYAVKFKKTLHFQIFNKSVKFWCNYDDSFIMFFIFLQTKSGFILKMHRGSSHYVLMMMYLMYLMSVHRYMHF